MKVWIDQDLCTGDGLCEEIAPDVFTLLDDGLAYVKEGDKVFSEPGRRRRSGRRPGRTWKRPRSSPPRSAPASASSSRSTESTDHGRTTVGHRARPRPGLVPGSSQSGPLRRSATRRSPVATRHVRRCPSSGGEDGSSSAGRARRRSRSGTGVDRERDAHHPSRRRRRAARPSRPGAASAASTNTSRSVGSRSGRCRCRGRRSVSAMRAGAGAQRPAARVAEDRADRRRPRPSRERQRRDVEPGDAQHREVAVRVERDDGGVEPSPVGVTTLGVALPATTCALVTTRSGAATKPLPVLDLVARLALDLHRRARAPARRRRRSSPTVGRRARRRSGPTRALEHLGERAVGRPAGPASPRCGGGVGRDVVDQRATIARARAPHAPASPACSRAPG